MHYHTSMFHSFRQSKVALFSQKTLREAVLGIGACLLILLGFSGYDATQWHIITRRWPTVQAGIDSRQSCSGRRVANCPYSLEYVYKGHTYYQVAELNKFEYNQRLDALQPGERSESITVPVKINPDSPEEIIVPPQSLDLLGGTLMIGIAFIVFLTVGIRLKQRFYKEEDDSNSKMGAL